jgi:hypothetical protein
MFATEMEDESYIYAHCAEEDDAGHEYGCGMEYEFYPETDTLRRWHDAVGLVTESVMTQQEWDELVEWHDANCKPTQTYHGITKVECLKCDYITTEVTEMEMWNDYGSNCMKGNHETGATRWWLADGTVRVVIQNAEGDLDHYIEEEA